MADVTGTIGSEPVELNNAATEATLKALLAAVQKQGQFIVQTNKQLDAMSKNMGKAGQPDGAGNNASKDAKKGLESVADGAMNVVKELNPLAKAAGMVGGVLGGLVKGALDTASNLTNFGEGLIDGQGKLSDFVKAFDAIPIIGGVFDMFAKLVQIQEQEYESYKDLTKIGVNFGGTLSDIRSSALGLGLTLNEFQEVAGKNRDVFLQLSGNVNKGAEAFVKINKALIQSPLGDQLLALGFSFKDINDLTGSYIRVRGGLTKEEMNNTALVTKKIADYGKELDLITQITGKSREEAEKVAEEEAQEANWKAYLNTLSKEDREAVESSLTQMTNMYGKAGADMVKSSQLGVGPMTDAGRDLQAMMPKLAGDIANHTKIVKQYGATSKEATDNLGKSILDAQKESKQYTGVIGIASDATKNLSGVIGFAADKERAGITSMDAYQKSINDIKKEQEDQQKSTAARAAETDKAFKQLGELLYSSLLPVINLVVPMMQEMAKSFTDFVTNNMPAIKEAIAKLAKMMGEFVQNMFSEEGRAKIVNDLTYYLKLMLIEVKKAIIPWYTESDAKADKDKLDTEKKAYDAVAEVKREEMANAGKKQALEDLAAGQDKEYYDKKIQESKNNLANLQKQAEAAGKDKDKIIAIQRQMDEEKLKTAELEKKKANVATLQDDPKAKADAEAKQKELEQKRSDADLQKATAVPHVDIKDYKKQDDENFKKMGVVDHIEDGVARGVELAAKGLGAVLPNILGGGILSNLGKKAEEDRIQNEADYFQGEEAKAKKKALEARAEGGPVKPGQPYWVGENGPEIMKPDTAGSIIPNNQLQMPGTMDLSAMQNAMNPMSGASDIFKNISSKASQLWNGTESDKGKDTKAPSFDDMVNNFSKSIQEKVTNVTTNLTTSHMTAEQGKSLVAELQTLNKQTADMLKYIRDTADHAKNTVDATKALNGNLFAR